MGKGISSILVVLILVLAVFTLTACRKKSVDEIKINEEPRPRAEEKEDKSDLLKDYYLVQGKWEFEQPRDRVHPAELDFTDMYMTIEGVNYTIEKDGEVVASGMLKDDGMYIKDTEDKIYILDSIWASGIYGNEISASYTTDAGIKFMDLNRVKKSPEEEYADFFNGSLENIEIFKTDSKNVVEYSVSISNNETYGVFEKSRSSYTVEQATIEAVCEEVLDLLWKYPLAEYEQVYEMPDCDKENNAYRLYIKRTDGITYSLMFKDKIPAQVDEVSKLICNLYDKYLDQTSYAKEDVDIVGKWKSETWDITFEFTADGKYTYSNAYTETPVKGHYEVCKNTVYSNDVRDIWSDTALSNRFLGIGEFDSLQYQDGKLYTYFIVLDAESTKIEMEKVE